MLRLDKGPAVDTSSLHHTPLVRISLAILTLGTPTLLNAMNYVSNTPYLPM